MSTLESIATNLVAAMIGAIAVTSWNFVKMRQRFRGARRFWRPFITEECLCLSGNLRPQGILEPLPGEIGEPERSTLIALMPLLRQHISTSGELSGLMGRGDHDAIVQVQAGLARIGLHSMMPERYGSPSEDELKKNLISIGGLNVNHVTTTLLEQMPSKLAVVVDPQSGRLAVRDLVHDQYYKGTVDEDGNIRDYGILIRSLNPYEPRKTVLILCGAYGFGSLAAAVIAFQEEAELQRRAAKSAYGIECLVCHERVGRQGAEIQRNSLIFVREISP